MRFSFWLFTALILAPTTGWGQEKTGEPRVTQVHGVLLTRTDGKWRPLEKGQPAPADADLVALPDAALVSGDGTVELDMKADIGHRGPLPVLESAITLHPSKKHALAVTLLRGIIVFRNKSAADAEVQVRVRGTDWSWTLRPGAKVGMELYGRYAPGVIKDFEKIEQDSCAQVACLVLEGKAFLRIGDEGFGLQAPPGVCLAQWDNLERRIHGTRLEKLPDFVRPMNDKEKDVFEKVCAAAQTLGAKDVAVALKQLLAKDDVVSRQTAVVAAGAIDDLVTISQGLEDEKHKEVREMAILVLRHYVGRGEKEMENLFRFLTGTAKRTPVQASLLLELLLGFTQEQRYQPATYDVLLRLLDHPRLGVRELAHWHLVRLVPLETPIAYNAAGSEKDRQESLRRWREAIPEGELPPHLREKK